MNFILIGQEKNKRKSVRFALNRYFMLMVAIIVAMNFTARSKTDENDDKKLNEDGLTQDVLKILKGGVLEKLKELGIEINGGNKPPNIEGTYSLIPDMCVKSTVPGDSWVGLRMVDAELTFSEQNNSKLTVLTYFDESGGQGGKGTGSFITGSGNKFSVFVKMTGHLNGLPLETIDVYSGEISSSGIKNYHCAQIVTKGNIYTTIPEGEGRLFNIGGAGLAERINK